jgi:phosphatidylglycerol:prolipoprotein diacylglycerol transferase
MRPRLAEGLNAAFGTRLFEWLVPSPAVMYALAMLAALVVVRYRSRAAPGVVPYHALGVGLWVMASALVGARLFYLFQYLPETLAQPLRIFDLGGATVSWGAYLGGGAGLLLYCRCYRLPGQPYADLLATTIGLAIAIGRWGCFLNGDDFGTRSDLPWAVRFPHGSYPFAQQARAHLIFPLDDLSLPVHPVQLYLSLNGLLLFFLTSWYWKRFRHRPGATFCFFWLLYAVSRFLLEFFRGDHDQFLLGVPTAQAMSIPMAAAAAIGLRHCLSRPAPPPAEREGFTHSAQGAPGPL